MAQAVPRLQVEPPRAGTSSATSGLSRLKWFTVPVTASDQADTTSQNDPSGAAGPASSPEVPPPELPQAASSDDEATATSDASASSPGRAVAVPERWRALYARTFMRLPHASSEHHAPEALRERS